MFRKCVIFFFLITAYILLQAHNFIPHHHKVEVPHHHHHDDHEDNDHHDFPFTDLTHNAEFGKVIVKPQVITGVDEQRVFKAECFVELFTRAPLFKPPPQYHPPDNDFPLHCIFLSHSVPLRAPPIPIILS